jgi:hypothetical protein
MGPSKEYMDHIIKRLEAMNPHLANGIHASENRFDPYKLPSTIDQIGMTAMEYLKNKKDPDIKPDSLFPDRN